MHGAVCTCPNRIDQWYSEGSAAPLAVDSGVISVVLGEVGMPTILEIYFVVVAVVVNSSTGGANTIFCGFTGPRKTGN